MNKRELFEKLTAAHSFDLPEDLVETEFKNLQENYFNSQNPVSEEHKKEIKDLLAYLSVVLNPGDEISLRSNCKITC